ncbi:MAG: diaminopimelate epimerase [Pseudomonadota bacterium]
MQIEFTKMEGLGNDFILMDDRDHHITEKIHYHALSKKLCDRRFGIGADGIILILHSQVCDLGFRIFNSDGSEAQMCGNGMRCFAKLAYEKQIIKKDEFTVETLAGKIIPKLLLDHNGKINSVKVDMGQPVLNPADIPFHSTRSKAIAEEIEVAGQKIIITAISMGNPHAVIFVDSLDTAPVTRLGPLIENCDLFPEKTNVEFVEVISDKELKMKVWERGAGVTLACGTGACAALVAANLNRKASAQALVHLDGGDLFIEWDQHSNHIYKTGPAHTVFSGNIEI